MIILNIILQSKEWLKTNFCTSSTHVLWMLVAICINNFTVVAAVVHLLHFCNHFYLVVSNGSSFDIILVSYWTASFYSMHRFGSVQMVEDLLCLYCICHWLLCTIHHVSFYSQDCLHHHWCCSENPNRFILLSIIYVILWLPNIGIISCF